jgi:mono/diheme cytochrome c family protein
VRRATIVSAFIFIVTFVSVQGRPQAQTVQTPKPTNLSGAELYASACAACHGPDGRGRERSQVGFDTPLPDFSDCSFASREQAADWIAVAHQGGPARGFSRIMPAFGRVFAEEDLAKIIGHLRSFCGDPAWPRGELNLPRAFFTEKAYPEDEAVLTAGIDLSGPGRVSTSFLFEKRFGARNQIELALPIEGGRADATSPWTGGAGDLAFAFKRDIAHSMDRGYIIAAGGELVFPTGDEAAGLSKNTPVFEPFVSYGQMLPRDMFLHAQAGVELPFNTDKADREAFWRVAAGKTWTQGPFGFGRSWTPMLELLAARELKADEPVHWDLVPQIQFSLNTRQHLLMNVGVRVPLNQRQGRYPQLLVYFLWDWFDGGLRDGW